ncbi:MAG: TetR family transcriptional regulator [Bacteroidetes bacterium]|nr:TetR family transcriptional regulator [Bacteroidota bacterium]
MNKPHKDIDTSTEEKIKKAARIVFHRKGFAGARTRDIAEEAGINLALLNYYFRSKEKLFDIIMLESLKGFMQSMTSVFHNPDTTIFEKVDVMANRYIDLLKEEPEIPLFIMSEMRHHPEKLIAEMKPRQFLMGSAFEQQFKAAVKTGEIKNVKMIHFIMNLLGMLVFPFIATPMLRSMTEMNDESWNSVLEERKKLIPQWIKLMFENH